jgi:hypothetical protein
MILVLMYGGLGNQLFEVAAALFLKKKSRQGIRLNGRSVYGGKDNRRFVIPELRFQIREGGKALHLFARLVRHLSRRFSGLALLSHNPLWTLLSDPADGTMDVLSQGSGSLVTILDGYWQYGLYPETFIERLRDKIVPRFPLSHRAVELLEGLKSNCTLAVHVRRGDYAHDDQTRSFHGVCDVEYYNRAFQFIGSHTRVDAVYVFSDEVRWARENIHFTQRTTYVSDDGNLRDVEELTVMSKCHHFIIANSTFSWWAARLATFPNKIVVAPRKWFVEPRALEQGLFPSDWHRLD